MMSLSTENPVHFHQPVLDDTISPSQIQQLFSLLHSELRAHSTSISETNRSVYSAEERKRRRMISNRESARRSRLRKKKHYEDLTEEANRLKLENRGLKSRLCTLARDCHLVQSNSNLLLSESIHLQHKLTGLHENLTPTMPLQ